MSDQSNSDLFPFDRRAAEALAGRIETCEFAVVKRYFRETWSDIELVVIVQPGFKLEEVAAYFFRPPAPGAQAKVILEPLRALGVLRYGVDSLEAAEDGQQETTILLDAIADEREVHVLYIAPIYFAQLI